jgi:DNA polymerase III gamma/tau subunit
MKRSAFGAMLAAAVLGMALVSPAVAKTAKECRAEWSAHKAENKAKGITEKAYVATCKGETAKPKATKKTSKEKAAEKKETKSKESKKEKAAEKKETKSKETKKEKAAEKKESKKKTAAETGKKTVKQCQAEWRANKAANQAKGVTEKAYVEQCRAGGAAMTPPAAAPAATKKMTSPAPAPAKKMAAPEPAPAPAKKMTSPAAAPAKPAASAEPAPATGKPAGANQYAAESMAKAHCRTGTVVWANLDSKIYHFAGTHAYGQTKKGAYMCEKDATAQGMRAAKNEKHP